ncbi:cytidine deaminase [Tribolium castaneum]|uniref:Cytidine deaminase n=1 Tax=Tribolium castaneum TaxID=7070 RepID=D6WXL4_TRICA|nr:PREDICTED: cytidine deaminase [Tribolium castaneum]EFA08865.1 Cytidine deaminase-like Protein [Tribolium castaneum]|eukprot:XP_971760.1 PREDICTED: cytidine deaminase [Tribolium castaneum]
MSSSDPTSANVVKFASLDSETQALLRQATASRLFAYCPYSKFQVGAAVATTTGAIFGGCNIENSAYTVGICAERTALAKAISEGFQSFKAVAVIGNQENVYTTPCGACRQFMSEYGNMKIFISKSDLEHVFVTDLGQLLPHQFQSPTINQ